jgi:hypothetical protein
MSESYRLRASARREDRLQTIFPIREIYDFVKDLNHINIYLIYDQRRLNEDHTSYFDQISFSLKKYFSIEISKNFPTNEEKLVAIKIDTKNPKESLDIITDNRDFDFASQLCIFVYDGEKIRKGLIVGLTRYYKLIKGKSTFYSSPKQIDKIPYRGRTTVDSEEEKNLAKEILFDYFSSDNVVECLLKDANDGELAFERLVLPGKEDHLHWHRKTEENLFERIKLCKKEDLMDLIEKEDSFSFYPSLSKRIDFGEQEIKVKSKFVRENDPPKILFKGDGTDLVARTSDILKSLCEELEIPSIYLFSGSKSARVQCFIDYEEIFGKLSAIDRDFPFIGASYQKKPRTQEELYENILTSFNKAFNLELIKKLAENKLLTRELNGKQVPNITFNSKSKFRPVSMLIDSPPTVSIGLGSPKLIKRLDEKSKENLGWKKNFIPLVCTPIEKCPSSEEEILQKFNILSSFDYFEKNYKNILGDMEKKITSRTLEKIFEKTEDNKEEFQDFCVLEEENFLRKHYGIPI